MTRKWNFPTLSSEEQRLGAELARRFANCSPISDLLVQRGITTIAAAEKFFHPSLRDLHDPFLMPDMDKAVERLNRAMGSKEKILVYGDYDVDGTTAVALVYRYLQNFYSELEYYIPTRYEEGYGISRKSIDDVAERGIKLVIILDCGIKAIDEIRYAAERGIDFIICDHHVPDAELPPAVAILNPKLEGSTYPCPHLSGCGVGYKLMQAFSISNGIATAELESMLDLVAVSIAADIVPMIDENRTMAYMGLKRLNSNPNLGLRAIIRTCGLGGKEISISDVVFKIGPRINASGRMQPGRDALSQKIDCNLQQGLAQGNHRHCGIATYRAVLQALGGADAIQRTCHRLLALGAGLRHIQGRGINPRPAGKFRRPRIRCRPVHEGGEHSRIYTAL